MTYTGRDVPVVQTLLMIHPTQNGWMIGLDFSHVGTLWCSLYNLCHVISIQPIELQQKLKWNGFGNSEAIYDLCIKVINAKDKVHAVPVRDVLTLSANFVKYYGSWGKVWKVDV